MSEKDVNTLTLDQVRDEIKEIQPVLQKAFDEAGKTLDMTNVTALGEGLETGQKSERLAEMNVRLRELGARKYQLEQAEEGRKAADELGKWLNEPADAAPIDNGQRGYKSFADAAMEHRDEWIKGRGSVAELDIDAKQFVDHEVKTVVSTGAGFAPQAIRTGVVVPAAFQTPMVVDMIPTVRTSQNAYVFMQQTTRTNNAAEIAESSDGDLKSLAESVFAWTQASETIRKLGHFVPVTDEQLEDIEGMEGVLRQDMLMGVRQRLSSQLLNGNGTAPNIEGFLDAGRTGVNDEDTTGEFIADAIDKLIESVRTNGFTEPSGIILHPSDWHGYRRATTTDGIYIAGHPSGEVATMMWGLPVALTTEISQGTALVGNFRDYSRLAVKRGIEVSISSEHASYFIQGVKAIKAEMRATLAVHREAAFAKTDEISVS